MAFDPSIISSIPDYSGNPVKAAERGATLKDMLDTAQLRGLEVNEKKTQAADDAQVKKILQSSDYSTPKGLAETAAKVNRVSPRASMDLMKFGQQYQSGQVSAEIDQLTLADKRQELIIGSIDPIIAQARAMKNSGASDLDVNAYIAQQMPGALQQLRQTKLPDGRPALPDDLLKEATRQPGSLPVLESWEAKTKAGKAAIEQRLQQYKADTQAKGEQEKERHDQQMEALGTRRETRQERDAKGNLTPEAIDLAAQRLVNGEAARDVLANFGRGKQGGQDIAAVQNRFAVLAKEANLSADEIALRQQEMRGSARAELALGEREGKIAPRVQEAKRFAQIALDASAKVPRGDWKMMNEAYQWVIDQDSGKELGTFQAANVSLINAYAAAIGGGQIHQHDQEVGAKLLSTANGPENYKAKVEQMIRETEAALQAPEDVKKMWRETRARDASERRGGKDTNSPGAPGATAQPSPGAAAAGASGGPKSSGLAAGSYKHVSGATVQILDE